LWWSHAPVRDHPADRAALRRVMAELFLVVRAMEHLVARAGDRSRPPAQGGGAGWAHRGEAGGGISRRGHPTARRRRVSLGGIEGAPAAQPLQFLRHRCAYRVQVTQVQQHYSCLRTLNTSPPLQRSSFKNSVHLIKSTRKQTPLVVTIID
jgi:hypothetical protein